jgi:hypothetical protein
MRSSFLILILTVVSSPSWATTNSEYAKGIEKVFSQFKGAKDLEAFMLEETDAKDRPFLQQFLKKYPIEKLPTVRAAGNSLQFVYGPNGLRISIVDGSRKIYRIRGVEVDLGEGRSLADQFRNLAEALREKSAWWMSWLIQYAYAQDETVGDEDGDPLKEAAAEEYLHAANLAAQAVDRYPQYMVVQKNAWKVTVLCASRIENPSATTSEEFTDLTNRSIERALSGKGKKNKPKPTIDDWAKRSLVQFKKVESKYCRNSAMAKFEEWLSRPHHFFYLPGNGTESPVGISGDVRSEKTFTKDITCDRILDAEKCLTSYIEKGIKSRLFETQDQELTNWLVKIETANSAHPQMAEKATSGGQGPASR